MWRQTRHVLCDTHILFDVYKVIIIPYDYESIKRRRGHMLSEGITVSISCCAGEVLKRQKRVTSLPFCFLFNHVPLLYALVSLVCCRELL